MAYAQVSYEYTALLAQRMEVVLEILHVTDSRGEQAAQTNDFLGSIGVNSYQQLLNELVAIEAAKARLNHQRAKILLQEAEQ